MIAALLTGLLVLSAPPLAAQTIVYQVITEDVVEVPATGSDRFVEAHPDTAADSSEVPANVPKGIASYGPFRVLDATHAALVDATNEKSPGQFTAMLHAFPGIRILEMVECPGTDDDRANLRLGLMIHQRGMVTHVPRDGSVRSGAVELFLAGARHAAEPGAEFAVHSWVDEFGLEPKDYGADAPENRVYIDYYREMGMTEAQARAFYAMTNSVPNSQAKWLTTADMAHWIKLDPADASAQKVDSALAVN